MRDIVVTALVMAVGLAIRLFVVLPYKQANEPSDRDGSTKRKRIDKALKRARSESILSRKDARPGWSPDEDVGPDLPVKTTKPEAGIYSDSAESSAGSLRVYQGSRRNTRP